MSSVFRHIFAVDRLLSEAASGQASLGISSTELTDLARRYLAKIREEISSGTTAPGYEEIIQGFKRELYGYKLAKFQPVINATGVILHTNLGRAPLPEC